jgi:hypothetical protein
MLILLFLGLAMLSEAQVASSTLLGEARDESAALAPGVRITAQHDATGFLRGP